MTYVGAVSALAMAGILWYVQVVHYPLFARVGPEAWSAYHADHERRSGWLIAPLMIVELGSATAIVILGGHGALALVGLGLALTTWVLTFTLAVPLHRRLNNAHDSSTITRLIAINWLRTAIWTAHGLVALALVS